MGHRPGGLQRRRRCLGLVLARRRALQGLPLERGRDGRAVGHRARPLPGARAVERARPDPQGADVRPDRTAGQPRRGREGVLVVPGRGAQPCLAALALPLPAGRVPLRGPRRREWSPRLPRPRVRAARHRRVRRRIATGSSTSTYAKADPTEVLARITIENKGPDAATLHVLPTLWFRNTWTWDPDHAEQPSISLAGDALRARNERLVPTCSRPRRHRTERPRSPCSARTRPTRRGCTAPRPSRRTPRTGSTTTWSPAPPP